MTYEEKTLNSKVIYDGAILKLRVDDVTTINGVSKREIVEHNGGSVIVAIREDGMIPMVRQYRKAGERVFLEVPAGKIDEGEEPEAAALRELREETGFTACNIKPLTKMYPSIGYAKEILYIYLASGLTAGETDFDDSEAIDIEFYTLDELYNMVMRGEIQDGKSQVAILYVKGLMTEGKLQAYLK